MKKYARDGTETGTAAIYSVPTQLTPDEDHRLRGIRAALAGNGKPEKMAADAMHVFQAQKYGVVFVTTDRRIWKRRHEVTRVCGFPILLPSEMPLVSR